MTLEEIRQAIRDRKHELQSELTRLDGALDALGGEASPASPVSPAPWGYKPDGTPRRRPAPPPEALAKSIATRRAKAKKQRRDAQPPREEVRLKILSSTKPTPAELKDRKVAHVTEEPA
jgi:hypothetical protein